MGDVGIGDDVAFLCGVAWGKEEGSRGLCVKDQRMGREF